MFLFWYIHNLLPQGQLNQGNRFAGEVVARMKDFRCKVAFLCQKSAKNHKIIVILPSIKPRYGFHIRHTRHSDLHLWFRP